MPDTTNTPAAPPALPKADEAAPAGPFRKVAVGGKATVVTVQGERLPAKVIAVRDKGLIDLTFEHRGEEVTITSAPYDPKATTSDSWH